MENEANGNFTSKKSEQKKVDKIPLEDLKKILEIGPETIKPLAKLEIERRLVK